MCWVRISTRRRCRNWWCRPMPGSRHAAWAITPWWAARWRPASNFRSSKWPQRALLLSLMVARPTARFARLADAPCARVQIFKIRNGAGRFYTRLKRRRNFRRRYRNAVGACAARTVNFGADDIALIVDALLFGGQLFPMAIGQANFRSRLGAAGGELGRTAAGHRVR